MRLVIVACWLACNGGSWLLLVNMLLVVGIADESEYRPVQKVEYVVVGIEGVGPGHWNKLLSHGVMGPT